MSFKLVSFLTFIFAVLQTELQPILSQILLPWQPGSLLLKFDWHHWIACPWESPVKASRRYLWWAICLKFCCHGNGVGRGRICLTSFNSPPTNTTYLLGASGIAVFSVLSGMATRVGRCRPIKFDWHRSIAQPWKPPVRCKHFRVLYKPSHCWFCPKFHCNGNGGLPWQRGWSW